MAIEIFSGTLAECNAVIAKANTAMGYSAGTSIDVPTEVDATADEYEVSIKTGTQKNALDTSETDKVAATRSFEAKDKLEAKVLVFLEQALPSYKKVTGLSLVSAGRGRVRAGSTDTITATIAPADAGDLKLYWTSEETRRATVQNTTGSTCVVTAVSGASGTVVIKCNSTDGSRVFATITLTVT